MHRLNDEWNGNERPNADHVNHVERGGFAQIDFARELRLVLWQAHWVPDVVRLICVFTSAAKAACIPALNAGLKACSTLQASSIYATCSTLKPAPFPRLLHPQATFIYGACSTLKRVPSARLLHALLKLCGINVPR
jgi:hypothetical protein